MPHMVIDVRIARPRREVIEWWTRLADDYRAEDPREQPHRIQVVARRPGQMDVLTWWRLPLGIEIAIPETMHLRSDGNFAVDVHFPLGLEQRDEFTFRHESGATHLTVRIDLAARNLIGRLVRPLYWHLYGRRMYPRTFRTAGILCERDAPHIPDERPHAGQDSTIS